ncbi:MAG: hypothetical protein ACFB11_09455, partial [Paracoccaceae bacterium]
MAFVDLYGPDLIATICLVRFWITIAEVHPAFQGGSIFRRGELRWISACFSLIAPKASVLTLPIHTPSSKATGLTL